MEGATKGFLWLLAVGSTWKLLSLRSADQYFSTEDFATTKRHLVSGTSSEEEELIVEGYHPSASIVRDNSSCFSGLWISTGHTPSGSLLSSDVLC